MKIFVSILLVVSLFVMPAVAAESTDPADPEVIDAIVEDIPAEDAGYTSFEMELLTVLGSIEGLLIFFCVALLFFGCYKLLRLFF